MSRLSKIGAAALAAFGWTSGTSAVTVTYLVVAGGGGAGGARFGSYSAGGGGGAGGYQTGTTSLNPTLSYTVTVGAGGANGTSLSDGKNGNNSQLGTLTASVGGGGGNYNIGAINGAGLAGGSGGGGSGVGPSTGGAGTSGQGFAGGGATDNSGGGAGGGGAGAAAATVASLSLAGTAGGVGISNSISGTSVYYAGGGGGGSYTPSAGAVGGLGGGGAGGANGVVGTSGTASTGGGAGGGGGTGASAAATNGGSGGSGVVIISYVGAQKFSGGVVTSVGGNTIHTFNTSGTLGVITPLTAASLVVAGGGGGGTGLATSNIGAGGGGGAGGYQTGSAITIDTNSIYAVVVGAGGAAGVANSTSSTSGSSSSVFGVTSTGGGLGGNYNGTNAAVGGSGGGGSYSSATGAAGTSGQGFAGGDAYIAGSPYGHGGGGGAGGVGGSATSSTAGIGGVGASNSISGTATYYAGGGGGGSGVTSTLGGVGGNGGGGKGGSGTIVGIAGTANLGAGGGGGGNQGAGGTVSSNGGAGGSGVVIISYPGSTQQMAGGIVTISGGNVIHTFNTSGYLTPITYYTKSLRFRSSASAYLNRTPATTTNQKTWTWSGWVKRGTLGTSQELFTAEINTQQYNLLYFGSDALNVLEYASGAIAQLITTQVFRDPAAWYHIVLAWDSTQATSSNRVKLYVNGTQVTAFSTAIYPPLNDNTYVNLSSAVHVMGRYNSSPSEYYDGEMTAINFIDGQALAPTSFGTFNSYNQWQPITYGGSYGTNGFYLPFTNTTSTTTLCYDSSPNGNNWTPNNISLTAGSTYDSLTDVPTLTSETVANYAVLNPLQNHDSGYTVALTNGNLSVAITYVSGGNMITVPSTVKTPASGKWYWEITVKSTLGGAASGIGIITPDSYIEAVLPPTDNYIYVQNGNKRNNSTVTAYGSSYTNGDVIGVALDVGAGTITFYKNNTSQGTAFTGIAAVPYYAVVTLNDTGSYAANFGQQPFVYTAPSGFLPLNTFNI
jgi:hypothetical protein